MTRLIGNDLEVVGQRILPLRRTTGLGNLPLYQAGERSGLQLNEVDSQLRYAREAFENR